MRTCGLSHQIMGPTTVKVAKTGLIRKKAAGCGCICLLIIVYDYSRGWDTGEFVMAYINTYTTVETFVHQLLVSENRECGKACIRLYNVLYI